MIFVQSEGTAARRRFPLYLVDAADGITPETGEAAGQPQISKAGGAWANTTNTLTALGNGAYYVELTATELNTLGPIQVRYKSANTAEFNAPGTVVALPVMIAAGAAGGVARHNELDNVGVAVGVVSQKLGGFTGASGDEVKTQLAAANTNISTLLSRLGAFTGSGVNTVLGFFRAIMRKDGSITTPSDVGGNYDHTTDSQEAIRDRGDASWITASGFSTHSAADVWSAGTRTLTAAGNEAIRDAILDRVLAGNHDMEGTPGEILQRLPTNPASAEALVQMEFNIEALINNARDAVNANTDTQTDALYMAVAALPAAVWAVGTRTITGGTIGTISGLTIAGLENMQTRFAGMIELDGAVYRFTANALEQSPAGGGGGGGTDWTDTEKAQIRHRLQIDGTKTEPTASTGDPITITPASADDKCNIGLIVYGDDNEPLEGETISYQLVAAPAGLEGLVQGTVRTSPASGEGGQITIEDLWRGATYDFWSGSGSRVTKKIPDASTLAIGPIVHID